MTDNSSDMGGKITLVNMYRDYTSSSSERIKLQDAVNNNKGAIVVSRRNGASSPISLSATLLFLFFIILLST